MVSLPGFEPGPSGPEPETLPDYAIESWWLHLGSNQGLPPYQDDTLPTEL